MNKNPFRSTDRTNFPPLDDFFHARPPTAPKQDESIDMSIAGRAALAEHHHRSRRCNHLDSSSSDADEWGRIMDDTTSNVSFSSSYYMKDRSRDASREEADTTLSSYFDKSVIESLLTPEKAAAVGVTIRNKTDASPKSSECCTSHTGMEDMFQAALRFNDDYQSSSDRDKSCVSFAPDTSFLGTVDKKKENMDELNFLFGSSPMAKEESFANSSFFGSPISIRRSPSSSVSEGSGVRGSPAFSDGISLRNTTPLKTGRHVTIEDQSSFASVLGLKSELDDVRELTPKKNLFTDDEATITPVLSNEVEPATIECNITEESIELVRHTPTKSVGIRGTLPQPRVFGSNLQNKVNLRADNSMDLSNKDVARKSNGVEQRYDQSANLFTNDEHVRGVRLCRASKLRALGLENLCSPSNSFVVDLDDSVDRSDF